MKSQGRRTWSRDELLVALNLYHKMTFGQFHSRQPVIKAVAAKLHRTPSSLAMKLSNFASIDPVQRIRGIKGLAGASKQDAILWEEFQRYREELVERSEKSLGVLFSAGDNEVVELSSQTGIHIRQRGPRGGEDVNGPSKQRRGQDFFRDVVLNNYGGRCGITGIAVRELLVASHILPWSTHPSTRLDAENGICLSRLHDAAFDRGLISWDEKLCLLISPAMHDQMDDGVIYTLFGAYKGHPLMLDSESIPPNPAYIAWHRKRFGFAR